MRIEAVFPGGSEVRAKVQGHSVLTDQSEDHGGKDLGPTPFDLFLTSIATCAGFYAMRFCQKRSISTKELVLSLETERNPETLRLETIKLELKVPDDFPAKYHKAILRAMDQCAVKKAIVDPPDIHSEVKGR